MSDCTCRRCDECEHCGCDCTEAQLAIHDAARDKVPCPGCGGPIHDKQWNTSPSELEPLVVVDDEAVWHERCWIAHIEADRGRHWYATLESVGQRLLPGFGATMRQGIERVAWGDRAA